MKKTLPLLITLFLLEANIHSVIKASSPVVLNVPTQINISQSFNVNVNFDGLTGDKIYRLRITFSKPGESKYFGETWNGSDWYNGESPIEYSKFFSITTDSNGAWSGEVQGKISYGIPNFDGTLGTYDFKIGRYTETGSTATWSEVTQVTLVDPNPPTSTPVLTDTVTPSSTPTKTPIPTKSPTPIHTQTPTKTPTPIKNPTPTPTTNIVKNTQTPTPTPSRIFQPPSIPISGIILGVNDKIESSKSNTFKTESMELKNEESTKDQALSISKKESSKKIIPISIAAGILLLFSSCIIVYKKQHGIIDE
jgi:hypothetical protein